MDRRDFEEHLKVVTDFYDTDVTHSRLKAQLEILAVHFQSTENASFKDIKEYLRSLSPSTRSLFSEVITLILVLPATNAASERSFSAMSRRVKNYLRSTMSQERLNYLMILPHVHKAEIDKLDIIQVANEFVSMNDHREHVFGKFSEQDLS